MNVLPAPAACQLSVDADGRYQLVMADRGLSAMLDLRPCGDLHTEAVRAGLPDLCADRLLEVIQSGDSNAWRILLGSSQQPREVILGVSHIESPGPLRQVLVTLAPLHNGHSLAQPDLPAAPVRHLSFELGPSLQVLAIDPTWTLLTGHPVAATLGRPLTDFMPPAAVAPLKALLRSERDGLLHPVARRRRQPVRTSQGDIVWLEPEQLQASGNGWRGSFVEVSANVRRNQLRLITDHAIDLAANGAVVIDVTRRLRPMVLANRRFTDITGYAESEVLGRSFRFFQGMESHQEGAAVLADALDHDRAATATLQLFHKTGRRCWIQVELVPVSDPDIGMVTHHVAIFTDVTDTRELIAKLSQQSSLLHAVHHDNPNGLVAFDEQGRVCLQNSAFKAMTGLYVVGQDRRKFFESLSAVCESAPTDLERELDRCAVLQCQLRLPKERVVELRKAQQDMARRTSLLVLRDVTAEVQLHRMQRDFLATAAHEMRTPMASIQGFSGLLLTEDMPAESRRELAERIHQQSLRLGRLLNDLLDLSRIESQSIGAIALSPVSMAPLLHDVLRTFGTPEMAPRLQLDVPRAEVVAHSNRAKLTQVLLNLVSNALKYSQQRVTVALRHDVDSGQAVVSVQDCGVGMDQATLAQLFTKFFRARPDDGVQGTGLGLYIARELTERMGGRLTVSSEPGVGSTFELGLPLQT